MTKRRAVLILACTGMAALASFAQEISFEGEERVSAVDLLVKMDGRPRPRGDPPGLEPRGPRWPGLAPLRHPPDRCRGQATTPRIPMNRAS